MVTIDKKSKEICKEHNCPNYRFPFDDDNADFCTLHNSIYHCSVGWCKQLRTNIKTNTDLTGELCYIHTGQRVTKKLIKNGVHGYAHLDPNLHSNVNYIPVKPGPLDRIKEQLLHGTRMMYKTGCPCDSCREANTKYEQARRHRHILRMHHLPVPQELETELKWLYAGTDFDFGLPEGQDSEPKKTGPQATGPISTVSDKDLSRGSGLPPFDL